MAEAVVTRLDGPAVEGAIAKDLARRAAAVAPAVIVLFGLIWGLGGAVSTAYAIAIVVVNFVCAAALLSTTARISLGLLMGAALFGYLVRLGLIFLAFWVVRDANWMKVVPFGITLVVTHLGLLFWEMRYVSASLAFPGLKPAAAPGPVGGSAQSRDSSGEKES
ncbi:MAG: ATP synthase subunit I [Acidimicrobiales bacterium]|nr:ATP synthase subunit I [Acidimicrobiales bacterium]